MSSVAPIMCPCCTHEPTMRARLRNEPVDIDEFILMRWHPPFGGPRTQVCTRWDEGWWECQVCGIKLTPHEAGVLVDAALMHYAPDCDSIGDDGIHADTRRAFKGGSRQP